MNLRGYTLTMNPEGTGLMCHPPGPCRCGHAVAFFKVQHGDWGCSNCLPDEPTTEQPKAVTP